MTYGYSAQMELIQLVNLRLVSIQEVAKPRLNPLENQTYAEENAIKEQRTVWVSDGKYKCNVYDRSKLQKGHSFDGPGIIQEKEATTLVGVDWNLHVDDYGNLIIQRNF